MGRELVRIAWVMAGALGMAGVGWGCGSATFACEGDVECGANGQCEAQGYCSFPDTQCASGRRFGEGSANVSGACVPVTPNEGTSSGDPTATGGGSGSEASTAPLTSTTAAMTTTDQGTSSTTTPAVEDESSSTGVLPASSSGAAEESSSFDSSSSSGEPVERVEDGIAVLYRFNTPGDTIEDLSGLMPSIDLALEGDGYTWTEGGLVIENALAIIRSADSVTRLRTACQASEEITVEAWVSSTVADQIPSRIVTFSETNSDRNFTLGLEDGLGVVWRARTDDAFNGLPQLVAAQPFAPGPVHLVATHAADGEEVVYVDGVQAVSAVRAGSFATWDAGSTYQLALGNENDLTRPWHGEFHLVAVYDRALSEDEVATNFSARY